MCGLGILPWEEELLDDVELADIRKIQQDEVLAWADGLPEAQVRATPVRPDCKLPDSSAIPGF